VLTVWPRSAQLAAAFLLGLATALLIVHGYAGLRWGAHPSDLERSQTLAYRIDLNRADRTELLQLPGVGPALAEQIEEYRRTHGDFRTVEDLVGVHGVGPATVERLRNWVCVQQTEGKDEPASASGRAAARGKQSPKTASKSAGAAKAAKLTEPIDINHATAAELQRLPGIGPKIAQRIIDERRNGLFKSTADLKRVPGIGVKTLERLRPYITVEPEPVRAIAAQIKT
jgi:competence protein ComEA